MITRQCPFCDGLCDLLKIINADRYRWECRACHARFTSG
jgi:hypothetical protein